MMARESSCHPPTPHQLAAQLITKLSLPRHPYFRSHPTAWDSLLPFKVTYQWHRPMQRVLAKAHRFLPPLLRVLHPQPTCQWKLMRW